jgi:hypothetical protein
LAKSSCGSLPLWLHQKIGQKTIDSGRAEEMEKHPNFPYYEGEGEHETSAKKNFNVMCQVMYLIQVQKT